jgi:hypothetical protein
MALRFQHLFHGTSSIYKPQIQEFGLLSKIGRLHLSTHPCVALLEAFRTVCGEEGFHNAYKPGVGGRPIIVQVERAAVKGLQRDAEYYNKEEAARRRCVQVRAAFTTALQIKPEYLSFLEGHLETKCDKLIEEIERKTRLSPLAPLREA